MRSRRREVVLYVRIRSRTYPFNVTYIRDRYPFRFLYGRDASEGSRAIALRRVFCFNRKLRWLFPFFFHGTTADITCGRLRNIYATFLRVRNSFSAKKHVVCNVRRWVVSRSSWLFNVSNGVCFKDISH